MSIKRVEHITFHSDVTTPATGNVYQRTYGDSLVVEFKTTGTFSAVIEGSIDGVEFKQIGTVLNLTALDLLGQSQITSKDNFYFLEMKNFKSARVRVLSTSAPLTVIGRATE